MTALAAKLEERLATWDSTTARAVEAQVAEIIRLADEDALDLGRARRIEQEVLDILDESEAR